MGSSLRISGLVKFHRQVRDRLRRGIPLKDREEFRDQVREVLFTVGEICARSGVSPAELPGPSRRAYAYLEELDLDDLPEPRPGTRGGGREIRVSGAMGIERALGRRLWRDLDVLLADESARRSLSSDITAQAGTLEDICDLNGATPADLAPRARRTYTWLKFLGEEENLGRHLRALRLGREEIGAVAPLGRVELLHASVLWRAKPISGRLSLRASEGFVAAGAEVWRALARRAGRGGTQADRVVLQEFAEGEDYASVLLELTAHAVPEGEAAGCHHDLAATFERVNEGHFGGKLTAPRLVWGEIPTGRKFGHYQPSRDKVLLSVSLDAPDVPPFVVEFVLYHELLHRKLGSRWSNGRRISHGPEFRAAERRFPRWREAEVFLATLARR